MKIVVARDAVYGPQKGASPSSIAQMDKWLWDYAMLSKDIVHRANPDAARAGAAGGLGFAFLAYTNAALGSGIQIVLEETKLEEYVREADLVITVKLDGCMMYLLCPPPLNKVTIHQHFSCRTLLMY